MLSPNANWTICKIIKGFLFIYWDKVLLCNPGWSVTVVLFPKAPEYWDYGYVQSCLHGISFMVLQIICLSDSHIAHQNFYVWIRLFSMYSLRRQPARDSRLPFWEWDVVTQRVQSPVGLSEAKVSAMHDILMHCMLWLVSCFQNLVWTLAHWRNTVISELDGRVKGSLWE